MQHEIAHQSPNPERVAGVFLAIKSVGDLYDGFGKLVELNVQTLKTSLAEQHALIDAAFSAQSLADAVEMQSKILPATLKKQHAYWRHVGEIAVQTQSEMLSGFVNYVGHVELPDAEAGNGAYDAPALVLPGEKAAADRVSGGVDGSGTAAIVDSAGNIVSKPG